MRFLWLLLIPGALLADPSSSLSEGSALNIAAAIRPPDGNISLVTGRSMEPFVGIHSVLLLERPTNLIVGDIVIFETDAGSICHPIIALHGDSALCEGYARSSRRDWVKLDRIRWRVAAVIFSSHSP